MILVAVLAGNGVCVGQSADDFSVAQKSFREGRFFEALGPARRAAGAEPDRSEAAHLYGLVLSALGQYRDAETQLHRAVALAPADARIQKDLGAVLIQLGRSDEAREVLEHSVQLDGTSPVSRMLLGRLYNNLGLIEQARDQFEKLPKSTRHFHQRTIQLPWCCSTQAISMVRKESLKRSWRIIRMMHTL